MNGKTAKRIRREVYGDYAPRNRKYFRDRGKQCIVSDDLRRAYKAAKIAYKRRKL